jgi:flagellar basal body-associated protein FliL
MDSNQPFDTTPPVEPLAPMAPPEAPKKSNKTVWIIVIVVIVLLCCCCAISSAVGYSQYGPIMQQIQNSIQTVP